MRTDQVVFKGTKEGLLVVIPRNQSIDALTRDLEQKLSRRDHFFAGAKAILDLGDRSLDDDIIVQLTDVLQRHGLKLTKVVGPFGIRMKELQEPRIHEKEPGMDDNILLPTALPEETLLLRRTIRSGQQATAPGNLVILGDVNPGAEVMAGGDIIVVGALRGLAHAGAPNNEQAVVVAFRLSPTQLRIANMITRSPDGRSRGPNVPEIARIRDGTIVIESYFPVGR